jgi:RND family efflux transporter MFP subunit
MLRRVSLLVPIVAAAACSGSSADPQQGPPAMPVELTTLRAVSVRDTTEYIATLKSRRSIVLQPLVDGQLTRIFVKSGDTVDANTPIMQIDPARQRATVTSSQATQASRMATLNYAKQQVDRTQRLYEGGAISQQELDQARSNFHSATAEVAALGAQIRENEVQLDYYRIVAPAHGVVGDIPVRVGDHVTPATKLTTIDENGLLEAYISVPVEKTRTLRMGMPVQLVDAEGQSMGEGQITFISPQVNEETQSVLIKSVVTNADNALRAAQFVRARVVWSTHDGVIIPALAVLRINGQPFVFLAENEGGRLVAKQKPVSLGELAAEGYPALAGVKAGDRLITGGVQKLGEGAPIAPKAEAAKGEATNGAAAKIEAPEANATRPAAAHGDAPKASGSKMGAGKAAASADGSKK